MARETNASERAFQYVWANRGATEVLLRLGQAVAAAPTQWRCGRACRRYKGIWVCRLDALAAALGPAPCRCRCRTDLLAGLPGAGAKAYFALVEVPAAGHTGSWPCPSPPASCASSVDKPASFHGYHVAFCASLASGQPGVSVGLGGPGSGPPHGAAQMDGALRRT
ncbi:hypothetical protein HXX76_013683 [Chlamydomonas incerta]|uniref:Uncharacterized protein n=1 Tax=Chlamydomonas incerta TaxID=51695 RepID=A0A835VTP1_CHLIN|nr:hypothetical protein HXX76_013683 [Chlamydomonas incerta]|eukprot:KAG2425473.1 hypothetical protein HXX76_013683 [Chlamydomonas incerta]